MAEDQIFTGGCLCGGVRYRITGPLPGVKACHCSQCRRTSGHYHAATSVLRENLDLLSKDSLRWFRSSAKAERGFCGTCGGNLFWRMIDHPRIAVTAGTLDSPTGLSTLLHMFCADKGDYYEITDGLPQYPGDDEA